jgi:hypothetical protein
MVKDDHLLFNLETEKEGTRVVKRGNKKLERKNRKER